MGNLLRKSRVKTATSTAVSPAKFASKTKADSKVSEATLTSRVIMDAKKRLLFYPDGDGKPMAESRQHMEAMAYLLEAIREILLQRGETAYICGNNFLYWVEGEPKKRVSPDVYVVPGVQDDYRDSYKTWEENGKAPTFVIELTSKKTKVRDLGFKRRLYRALGVREYILFDPKGSYLKPRLQAFFRVGNQFRGRVAKNNRLFSEELKVEFVVSGELLRVYDPTGERTMPTFVEALRQREDAERQREEAERQREEAERRQSLAETKQFEAERLRAEGDAENARLREQLENLLKERSN